MNRYTPGPWKADGHYIVGQDGSTVASVFYVPDKKFDANLHLIAAAPELLEVMRDMAERWELMALRHGEAEINGVRCDVSANLARAAIARAEAGA